MFDSYGLPLNWYKPSDVVEWVFEHFETVSSNAMTLQEMNSQSCGQYALMYLKAKARGQSIDDFRSLFKKGDFVHNDHLVGEVIKPLLNSRVKNLKCCKQDNSRSCPLDIEIKKTLFFLVYTHTKIHDVMCTVSVSKSV